MVANYKGKTKGSEEETRRGAYIHRNSKDYTLKMQPSHKDYRLVYSKRVLDPTTAKTYPYGYEHLTPEDLDLLDLDCLTEL